MKDSFSEYKMALKARYQSVKNGPHADHLMQPTVAKLRNLCMDLYGDGRRQPDDKDVFKAFFGFDYDSRINKEVIDLTDKFRPIRKFLLEQSDITESNYVAANMLAVLLDFEMRPLRKFRSGFKGEIQEEKFRGEPGNTIPELPVSDDEVGEEQVRFIQKRRQKVPIVTVGLMALLLVAVYLSVQYYSEKSGQCMQWQKDHYEVMDCQQQSTFHTPIIAVDKNVLQLRQIFPKKQDAFIKDGQPAIWYAKSDNQVDFFNQGGKHPVTGKNLGPVTFTIMNNWGR